MDTDGEGCGVIEPSFRSTQVKSMKLVIVLWGSGFGFKGPTPTPQITCSLKLLNTTLQFEFFFNVTYI